MTIASLLIIIFLFNCIHLISATTYTCDPTLSCGCAAVPTVVTSRIVGGEKAANYTWGWMVSLQYLNDHRCGASLVSSQYAITAAHCVRKFLNGQSGLSIVVGTNYWNDTSSSTFQRRAVTRIIIHPSYHSPDHIHDIAILQFSPLTISSESKLAFICLPSPNQDPFQVNDSLVATGWGVTYEDSYLVSDYLQQVTVQAYSSTSTDCARSGLNDSYIQFCAGIPAGGKDTCQGDSGGPIMAFVNDHWVLAGITSFGEGCAQARYPGVYARVAAYISFLNSIIYSPVAEETTTTNNQLISGSNEHCILNKSILILMFSISFFLKIKTLL